MLKFFRFLIAISIIVLLVMAYLSSEFAKQPEHDLNSVLVQIQNTVNEKAPAMRAEMQKLTEEIKKKLPENTSAFFGSNAVVSEISSSTASVKDETGTAIATSMESLQELIKKLKDQNMPELANRVKAVYEEVVKSDSEKKGQ